MYKILIANRDEFDTNGIKWLIHSSISSASVSTVSTYENMTRQLELLRPDLLIVELEILDRQSTFLNTLRITRPSVIALTMEATYEQAKKAIDIGVLSLLLKPISPEALLKAVQKALREIAVTDTDSLANERKANGKTIEYEQLFLDNENANDTYSIIGLKTENPSDSTHLYQFLKTYQFAEKPQIIPIGDMIVCIAKETSMCWATEFKRFLMDWIKESKIPAAIVLHKGNGNPTTVRKQYLEIKQMMEVTFFEGYERVIEGLSPLEWKFIDPLLTPSEQRMWINFLNQNDTEGIREWLYAEFLGFTAPYPEPGLIRIRLTSILAQIRRHMKTYHLNEGELETQYLEMFQMILYSPLIYRIVQHLVLFAANVLKKIEDKSYDRQDTIEKCMVYIESNFWNSVVSLTDVARHIDRNPSYLSSLLSARTGKTFREHLTETRIRHASKLLIETEMSIKEISLSSGFSNQQYFHKVFKKHFHQSPKEYRKKRSF